MAVDSDFLNRWSRRKLAAGTAPESLAPAPAERDDAATAAEAQANRAAAEAVDLEALDRGSDLSVFFRAGVPAELTRAAMARLWRADPVFANLDGLVDYGEDFRSPNLTMATFRSAWQAGRGYLREETAAPSPPEEPTQPEPHSETGPREVTAAEAEEEAAPGAASETAAEIAAEVAEPARPVANPRLALRARLGLPGSAAKPG